MHIELLDDDSTPHLGFSSEDVNPGGWLSWIDKIGDIASRTKTAASKAKEKVCRFGNSLLGRAVQASVAESTGVYVGGALVSTAMRTFAQRTSVLLGPGAVVVSSMSAITLMNRENTQETRRWAMAAFTTASLATVMVFVCPDISLAAGIVGEGVGYIIGSLAGGHLGSRAVGSELPFMDLNQPSSSYVGRTLPSLIMPRCVSTLIPIQNSALNNMRNIAVSQITYYAIPACANMDLLTPPAPGRRLELLAPPSVMRSLITMSHDQGIPGLVNEWTSCMTENAVIRGFVGNQILNLLEGDGAYNVITRSFTHYNAFLQNDPEIQEALIQFRAAYDRGEESDSLATILSQKMVTKFPGLSLMPQEVKNTFKTASETIASNLVQTIRTQESNLCGFQLSSEEELVYLEKLLNVYFHSLFPYALVNIVQFQRPLSPSEMQNFYRSLNHMVQHLYIQNLPLVNRVAGLVEEVSDQAIRIGLPIEGAQNIEEIQEVGVACHSTLLQVLYFVAYELYQFLTHLIYGKSEVEQAIWVEVDEGSAG